MKGIYLTEEGKQKIEAEYKRFSKSDQWQDQMRASFLEEILKSAIILPVEESWHQLFAKNMISATYIPKFKEDTLADVFEKEQTQGVIIQPKS